MFLCSALGSEVEHKDIGGLCVIVGQSVYVQSRQAGRELAQSAARTGGGGPRVGRLRGQNAHKTVPHITSDIYQTLVSRYIASRAGTSLAYLICVI